MLLLITMLVYIRSIFYNNNHLWMDNSKVNVNIPVNELCKRLYVNIQEQTRY